jgi:hypothetical protein
MIDLRVTFEDGQTFAIWPDKLKDPEKCISWLITWDSTVISFIPNAILPPNRCPFGSSVILKHSDGEDTCPFTEHTHESTSFQVQVPQTLPRPISLVAKIDPVTTFQLIMAKRADKSSESASSPVQSSQPSTGRATTAIQISLYEPAQIEPVGRQMIPGVTTLGKLYKALPSAFPRRGVDFFCICEVAQSHEVVRILLKDKKSDGLEITPMRLR